MARPRTFNETAETLREMYITRNMKVTHIAKYFGVSGGVVEKRLKEYGIQKEIALRLKVDRLPYVAPPRKFKLTADELRALYIDQKLTDAEIGRQLGVSNVTVAIYRKRHGIRRETALVVHEIPREELHEMYVNKKQTMGEICKHFGCGESTVRTNIIRYGLGIDRSEVASRRLEANRKKYTYRFECQGYRKIQMPGHPGANPEGYVSEHRYVAESAIGRYLEIDEVVHHLNLIKLDNRVENLAVLRKFEHSLVHKYMEKVCAYWCMPGAVRPEPLEFNREVFWGGSYVTSVDFTTIEKRRMIESRKSSKKPKGSFAELFKATVDAVPEKGKQSIN
jgi:DNA-binding CsgD family transcriptional regulator